MKGSRTRPLPTPYRQHLNLPTGSPGRVMLQPPPLQPPHQLLRMTCQFFGGQRISINDPTWLDKKTQHAKLPKHNFFCQQVKAVSTCCTHGGNDSLHIVLTMSFSRHSGSPSNTWQKISAILNPESTSLDGTEIERLMRLMCFYLDKHPHETWHVCGMVLACVTCFQLAILVKYETERVIKAQFMIWYNQRLSLPYFRSK